jgi:hypothetical protein
VVVLALPSAPACADSDAILIAQEQLKAKGTHALYFKGRSIEIETAADGRGQRPWIAAASAQRGLTLAQDDPRTTDRTRNRAKEQWTRERRADGRARTFADDDP